MSVTNLAVDHNITNLFMEFEGRRVKITTMRGQRIDCTIASAHAEFVVVDVYNPQNREYDITTAIMYHAVEQVELK